MKEIALDNDHDFIWSATRKNALTGEPEPATGLAALTAHLSATKGGTAIHVDLSRDLAERDAKPGEYFGTVDGDDLRTHLEADYIGAIVFEVVSDAGNVKYSAPRKIVSVRIP